MSDTSGIQSNISTPPLPDILLDKHEELGRATTYRPEKIITWQIGLQKIFWFKKITKCWVEEPLFLLFARDDQSQVVF